MAAPALSSAGRAARSALVRASGVRAVIFDWAGTIVDYGSCAPAEAFVEVFRRFGVTIDVATARGPMGKNKRDHISEIIYAPHVVPAWKAAHGGAAPTEADVDAIYKIFTPVQVEVVRRYSEPIPGVLDAFAALRERGIKIGSCSGYNPDIMAAVMEEAGKRGLRVDALECAGASNGRPKPWMSTCVAEALDVFPLSGCVKVDDTLPGISEGLNAGMWTVAVTRSGNELGLGMAEAAALERTDPAAYAARIAAATARFESVGAHYVIASVADLLPVLEDIEGRIKAGESPLMA